MADIALCQNCNDDADSNYQCSGDPNACGACRKLAALQQKIKETRMLLNGLKGECRQLREQANHYHDPFIHRVPPEIASTIFEFCIPDIMSLSLSGDISREIIYAPLVLSAICGTWRAVAHSTPRLWTGLPLICPLNRQTYLPKCISLHAVREWLDRAGELPISINFYSDFDEDTWEDSGSRAATCSILHVLDDYSRRWLHLKFEGIPDILYQFSCEDWGLPQLRTLDLKITDFGSPRRPSDRPLYLHPTQLETLSIHGRIFITLVDLDWDYLTQLTMTSCTLSECFEALRIAPSLSQFNVLLSPDRRNEVIEFPLPQFPIMHAKLQYLLFQESQCTCEGILTYLTCPSLQTMEVSNWHQFDMTMTPIMEFLERSRCSLEGLCIDCYSLPPESIMSLCRGVPTLLHLKLHFASKDPVPTNLFSDLAMFSASAKEPQYLPSLQSLDLSSYIFPDWAKLPDIFGTRTSNSHSIERHRHALKSVRILMDLVCDTDEETLKSILWLRDSSDVEWKITYGEDKQDMIALEIDRYREAGESNSTST